MILNYRRSISAVLVELRVLAEGQLYQDLYPSDSACGLLAKPYADGYKSSYRLDTRLSAKTRSGYAQLVQYRRAGLLSTTKTVVI